MLKTHSDLTSVLSNQLLLPAPPPQALPPHPLRPQPRLPSLPALRQHLPPLHLPSHPSPRLPSLPTLLTHPLLRLLTHHPPMSTPSLTHPLLLLLLLLVRRTRTSVHGGTSTGTLTELPMVVSCKPVVWILQYHHSGQLGRVLIISRTIFKGHFHE